MRRNLNPGEPIYTLGYVQREAHEAAAAPVGARPRTRFIASTDQPDRYDDIVDQATWNVDNFRKNPRAPWGHDYSIPPVGRVVEVGPAEIGPSMGRLPCTIEWDTQNPENALARLVAQQYTDGFLDAVSVGFRPGRAIPRKQLPKEDPRYKEAGYGVVYYDCDLLEISAVVIPANADALAAKGLPPARLTPEEVREEMRRLVREDDELRDELLDLVASSAEMRVARAAEAEALVLAAMLGLDRR